MPRVKASPNTRAKHKKVLKLAKGYRGSRSKLFKRANEAVLRAGEHAFFGRKLRKRQMRRLWILRINAALKPHSVKYSQFISGLKKANIDLNRKTLSEMAQNDPQAFEKVVEKAIKAFNK